MTTIPTTNNTDFRCLVVNLHLTLTFHNKLPPRRLYHDQAGGLFVSGQADRVAFVET